MNTFFSPEIFLLCALEVCASDDDGGTDVERVLVWAVCSREVVNTVVNSVCSEQESCSFGRMEC